MMVQHLKKFISLSLYNYVYNARLNIILDFKFIDGLPGLAKATSSLRTD